MDVASVFVFFGRGSLVSITGSLFELAGEDAVSSIVLFAGGRRVSFPVFLSEDCFGGLAAVELASVHVSHDLMKRIIKKMMDSRNPVDS